MSTQNPKAILQMSLTEFLESAPPSAKAKITDLYAIESALFGGGTNWAVDTPDIQLYCGSKNCGGQRFFAGDKSKLNTRNQVFLIYTCKNCNQTKKTFAITTAEEYPSSAEGTALKLGEDPPFGPPTPGRLISLIGPDRENFLKGRRAKNHGLGIGAFAYYRRVVEDQKGRLIDEIARVADRLGADADTLKRFERP